MAFDAERSPESAESPISAEAVIDMETMRIITQELEEEGKFPDSTATYEGDELIINGKGVVSVFSIDQVTGEVVLDTSKSKDYAGIKNATESGQDIHANRKDIIKDCISTNTGSVIEDAA